jgi:hypothetical protein
LVSAPPATRFLEETSFNAAPMISINTIEPAPLLAAVIYYTKLTMAMLFAVATGDEQLPGTE